MFVDVKKNVCSQDKLPLTSTPVPGFLVSLLEKGDAVDPKIPHTFKLFHVKKSYYFQANDSDEQKKYVKVAFAIAAHFGGVFTNCHRIHISSVEIHWS